MAEFNIHENMYVKKSLGGVEDVERGFGQVTQIRANSNVKITQMNASHFQGVLVFDTYEELLNTPKDYMGDKKCAVVKETGQIYFSYGKGWGTAQNIAFQVKTIEDLKIVPPEVGICVVSDPVRGGVFSYVKANANENNGGTIFNGWTRNYENSVNVHWFGAKADGVTDDTEAIQKTLAFSTDVVFPEGKYLISKTLTLQPHAHIKGSSNTIIVSEGDLTMVKASVGAIIENLTFKGLVENSQQVGVLLYGGSGSSSVSKVRVVGCKFSAIGGSAVSIANIEPLQSNEIVECSFSGCGIGIELGNGAYQSIVSDCMFLSCSVGLKHSGYSAVISNNTFTNSSIGMYFVAGNASDAKTLISACIVTASRDKALKCEGISHHGYMFENCTFSGESTFINSNLMIFSKCNFLNSSISFQNSNYNKFIECQSENLRVANDVGNTPTCNLFIRPILETQREDFHVGGWVEATRIDSDFQISKNAITPLQFNDFKQGLCFHPTFSKFTFYNKDNGIFDFTQIITPENATHIFADIHLIFSANDQTTFNNLTLFLYRITDSSDTLQAIDSSRMYLFSTYLGWDNNYMITSYNGKIPRGLYKVCVRLGDISNFKLFKNNYPMANSKGKINQVARFWGI